MTKEQAIEELRISECYSVIPSVEALDIAIKALEQKPCDDCISRADVKQFVSYIQSIKDSHNEQDTPINYGTICDLVIRGWKLMELPSVTPTRKQGKWEHDKLFGECAYVCSFCHTIWTSSEIENMHYCPTCGAEMRGVENENIN